MQSAMQTKASVRVSAPKASRAAVVVRAAPQGRRELLGLGAILLSAIGGSAKAGTVEDLLAASTANKALNDKKRLATSYANLARTRTVADGTCTVFTNNFLGCEELATNENKFLAEDKKLECEGKESGKCASRMTGFKN